MNPDPIRLDLLREVQRRLDRPSGELSHLARVRRLGRLVSELSRGRRSVRGLLFEIGCEALTGVEELDRAELLRVDLGRAA